MSSQLFRKVVGKLQRSADFIRRQITVASEAAKSSDGEVAQAAVQRNLRHALNAELLGNAHRIGVRLQPRRIQSVNSHARFINEAWREGVGFA